MGMYLDIANRVERERPAATPQAVPAALEFVTPPAFDATRVREAEGKQAALAGLVNDGWSAGRWIERLEYLAGLCESLNPKLAAAHRQRSASIREALAVEGVT